MRIGIMVMPVVMIVIMAVVMAMMMVMIHIQPAGPGAEMVAQVAILDIASRRRDALTFDVMMMRLLWKPNFCFKPQNLRPILT